MTKKRRMMTGIDEVGRGALAGPVLVAALTLPRGINLKIGNLAKLRDSKHLSAKQRKEWLEFVDANPEISYAVSRVSPHVIDRRNIRRAADLAATRAYKKLAENSGSQSLNRVYLDGGLYIHVDPVDYPRLSASTIIRGDEKINVIKLASIVAKVKRDNYMVKLHKKHPKYGFDEHKGYGTKKHKRAIGRHGLTDFHRKSFCKFV